jgi:hypothetical protein
MPSKYETSIGDVTTNIPASERSIINMSSINKELININQPNIDHRNKYFNIKSEMTDQNDYSL